MNSIALSGDIEKERGPRDRRTVRPRDRRRERAKPSPTRAARHADGRRCDEERSSSTCPYRKIRAGYIDDAIHRGWAVVGYFRLRARGAGSVRPSPAIGGFEQCCSNSRKTAANAAGAARRTQRHDRDIPDGSNRLGAPHSRSARAIAVMSDDRECRGTEPAERTDCHSRRQYDRKPARCQRRFRPDDGKRATGIRKPPADPAQNQSVAGREWQPAYPAPAQHDDLLPKHKDLCFQRCP
jgi:hypothetical protein